MGCAVVNYSRSNREFMEYLFRLCLIDCFSTRGIRGYNWGYDLEYLST